MSVGVRGAVALLGLVWLAGCVLSPETEEAAATGYVFEDGAPAGEDRAAEAGSEESDTAASDEAPADAPPAGEAPAEEAPSNETSAEDAPSEQAETAPPGPTRIDPNAEARSKCTRRGGDFTRTPAGLFVCVQRTRDANRTCSKASDCQGACLARSGTCAPVTPLIGCYDQITARGGMATICID